MPQSQRLSIEQAISRAKKAAKQGDTATALQLYNAVLQHQPNHPVAKKGLRKLQKGLPRNQFAQAKTANHLQDQINALIKLYHTGQMAKTEQTCRKLLQTCPQSSTVFNVLGMALQRQDKLQEAVQAFDKAVELKPDSTEAYSNRGNVLKDLGMLKEAVESHERAIELKPDYAEAYSNLGNALKDLGMLKEAVESHEKAIELKPDYAGAYSNLGNALKDLGMLKEAVESHERAIELKPGYAKAYCNRGNALRDLGKLNEAVESYEEAIELKPDYADAYGGRGGALRDLGNLKEAVESHEKAVELKPDYGGAHYNLSTLKKYKADDAQLELMESLLTNSEPSESDRMYFCFALAKAYEDLGEYGKSFNYLGEGNRLRRKELNYNIDDDRRRFAKIRGIFTAGSPAPDVAPDGNASIQPLFIVGMPRSGTSLVEHILASHTKVHGAGELITMNRLVTPILKSSQDKSKLSRNEISAIHDGYLEAFAALNVPEKIVTDKMPLNFQWIGFIWMIWWNITSSTLI
jgi:tetratricopeptide (TPR) repeat protein